MPSEATYDKLDRARVDRFTRTVMRDNAAVFFGAMTYLGSRLEIFESMAGQGPITAAQLAERSGVNERYLREWLGAMVAAGYVELDENTGDYHLPGEHAMVLADRDSPLYMAGLLRMTVPLMKMVPQLEEVFRSGGGIATADYPAEFFEARDMESRPRYMYHLVRKWLPQMPAIHERLQRGCRVIDIGCGGGYALISMASAYPSSKFTGSDLHDLSIEKARNNAAEAGLQEILEFAVADGIPDQLGKFDLVTTFDVVHDSPDPDALLRSIRQGLAEGGIYLMVELNASSRVEDNISDWGKMLYSLSTMFCMTTSLADGGAGIGALMGEDTARELAYQAGFRSFEKLPLDDEYFAFYQLKA